MLLRERCWHVSDDPTKQAVGKRYGAYLAAGVELDANGASASFTGGRPEVLEMDCLLDLSLFKTKLALFMNLARPLGLSPEPPAEPWPEAEVLMVVKRLSRRS